MQYVIQGVMIATVVVLVLNAVKYFGSSSLRDVSADSVVSEKKDSVNTITNYKGQALFREKCISCHSFSKPDAAKFIVGFEKRAPSKKLLYEFIRNSGEVIKSGEPYYSNLYKEYDVLMISFPELTNQQISDLIEYMKQAEKVNGYE